MTFTVNIYCPGCDKRVGVEGTMIDAVPGSYYEPGHPAYFEPSYPDCQRCGTDWDYEEERAMTDEAMEAVDDH